MNLPTPALALLLVVACARRRETDGAIGAPPTPRAGPATCAVAGVEAAHPVERVGVPAGCTLSGGGAPTSPRVIRTAEEMAAALTCSGAERPAVDLATHDVVVVRYTMSPAHAGTEALDDGTTVTLVTRFRPPCPRDPMPMPMNGTLAFTLPKGAVRGYREASCTLPLRCP